MILDLCSLPKKLQGITHSVGLTFGVGDTSTPRLTIGIEQDN